LSSLCLLAGTRPRAAGADSPDAHLVSCTIIPNRAANTARSSRGIGHRSQSAERGGTCVGEDARLMIPIGKSQPVSSSGEIHQACSGS
jgi:hypothetical protein